MKPTAFPSHASGVIERMAGFTAHLRQNGYSVGVRETECALHAMQSIDVCDSGDVRLACQAVFANRSDYHQQFDDVFDAYWFNRGRQSSALQISQTRTSDRRNPIQQNAEASDSGSGNAQNDEADDAQDGDANAGGEGKLTGSRNRNLEKIDLREFMTPESLAEAELIAARLARAISHRRSRRRVAASRGAMLDLRRVMRHCISNGGEPVHLFKRKKPPRPVRLVTLLDVSGSMLVYSRVFLAFVKGLVSHDTRTDAYLFHTSLVRISDALRDSDTFRAVNALTLKAQGFGGGTRIAHNIEQFNQQYARQMVNGRSVVIILSDGYDTDPPERLEGALARLKKRGCKLVWLNPLKGWKDYEPVARGMAAALPFLDVFEAANTLESLAALEPHLSNL
ncbi:MAG: VWA domain-containing protein [Granulosicoccus sp.]